MSNDMEHLDLRNVDIDESHRKVENRIVDTLYSTPSQEKEAQDMSVERKALELVAAELGRVLNNANKSVSRVIEQGSEIIYRTVIVPKNQAVPIVRTNYERSRLTLWTAPDVINAVQSVAIGADPNLQFDTSQLLFPFNGVIVCNAVELRGVRDLWGVANAGDLGGDVAYLNIVEEFIA